MKTVQSVSLRLGMYVRMHALDPTYCGLKRIGSTAWIRLFVINLMTTMMLSGMSIQNVTQLSSTTASSNIL